MTSISSFLTAHYERYNKELHRSLRRGASLSASLEEEDGPSYEDSTVIGSEKGEVREIAHAFFSSFLDERAPKVSEKKPTELYLTFSVLSKRTLGSVSTKIVTTLGFTADAHVSKKGLSIKMGMPELSSVTLSE